MSLGAEHALIHALRQPGAETQVTDAIGAACAADPAFAADVARLMLSSAPRPVPPHALLPSQLRCTRELGIEGGRVDLSFTDEAGNWHLLVEVKLHSGYGPRQLERYLEALRSEACHRVLLAVTRSVPRRGEFAAGANPNWGGSIRWSKLLPGLRELRPRPALLADQWSLLLDVLEEEGAMGFTQPDPELLRAWTLARGARKHVELLLNSIQDRLVASAEEMVGKEGSVSLVPPAPRSAIRITSGDAYFEFRLSEDGPRRLRVGLRGSGPPLRALVAFRRPEGHDAGSEAALALRRAEELDFDARSGSRFSYLYKALGDAEIGSPDLPEHVAGWIEEQMTALWATGVLQVPLGATTEPEADAEDEDAEPQA